MDASWFETMAADARNRPDVYRRLGFGDLRLVVEETDASGPHRFGLILDGYDVVPTGELGDVDAFRPDASITGRGRPGTRWPPTSPPTEGRTWPTRSTP